MEPLANLDSGICRGVFENPESRCIFQVVLKHTRAVRAARKIIFETESQGPSPFAKSIRKNGRGFGNRSCDTLRAMSNESNFASFWPEYVRAHSQPGTRIIHLAGTLFGWALFVAAIVLQRWRWVAAALIVSYALAWISHFWVEHNRPATFEHPLWSWRADQKMVALMLIGKMSDEVRRCAGTQN
jgi:hypothetical protein